MAKRKSGGKSLVIVESPAKAKTINKYLGDDYVVKASLGHVRDLPERDIGIDVTANFTPTYEIVKSRVKVISELRKLAADADQVYLATDLDREGEAIAWHLSEALNLTPDRAQRVIFNAITKKAIQEAFANPHQLDLDRVNAQQARRILDRIVGYELSPLLWNKIAKGLSAGRVQSVAVRLIVDREREIRDFVPEEYWVIEPVFTTDAGQASRLAADWQEFLTGEAAIAAGKAPSMAEQRAWIESHSGFRAELVEFPIGEKFRPASSPKQVTALETVDLPEPVWTFETAAREAMKAAGALGYETRIIQETPRAEYPHFHQISVEVESAIDSRRMPAYHVKSIETKRRVVRPYGPFTTASLQQQASTVMRFAASRTMRVAQGLYEGVDLGGEGPVGLITYMRTDSTNLSGEALTMARGFIQSEYGGKYLPEQPNFFGKRQERAQEAHEAIRPTDATRTPESLRSLLTDEQYKLYDLIWRRFIACQMNPAEWDSTTVEIIARTSLGDALFRSSGRVLVFDGFYRVMGVPDDEPILPPLQEGQAVAPIELVPVQKYTNPPARYTEASLVKSLESEGIGRPSTYAAIIDTIQDRGYVEQEDRKFFPSALGELVTDQLVQHFPKIMDVKFTSFMEDELDKIEEAHLDWVHVLHEFYDPFKELLGKAADEMQGARATPSEVKCPTCGAAMVYRWSKTGRFLSCSAYPKCKATMNVDRNGQPIIPKISDVPCALCGKPMVQRQSKTGHFLGCTGYPECRSTVACDEQGHPLRKVKEEELKRPCDACGEGTMTVKKKGRKAFLGCDQYPKCKNTAPLPADVQLDRPPAPPAEQAGVNCEKCRRPMVIREGKRGKFIACTGYPKCRNTKPIERLEELRAAAAAGGADAGGSDQNPDREGGVEGGAGAPRKAARRAIAAKGEPGEPPPGFAMTRTGRPVVEKLPGEDDVLDCPECGSAMTLKRGRFGPFFSCTNFPKCKFNANLRGEAKKEAEELMPAPARPKPIPTDIPCDECGSPMLLRQGTRGKFLGCSGYPKCKTTKEVPPGFDVEKATALAGAAS